MYVSSAGGSGGVSGASALIVTSVGLGRDGCRSGLPSSTLRLKSARLRAPFAWSSS